MNRGQLQHYQRLVDFKGDCDKSKHPFDCFDCLSNYQVTKVVCTQDIAYAIAVEVISKYKINKVIKGNLVMTNDEIEHYQNIIKHKGNCYYYNQSRIIRCRNCLCTVVNETTCLDDVTLAKATNIMNNYYRVAKLKKLLKNGVN